jgi:hypothetical protein
VLQDTPSAKTVCACPVYSIFPNNASITTHGNNKIE